MRGRTCSTAAPTTARRSRWRRGWRRSTSSRSPARWKRSTRSPTQLRDGLARDRRAARRCGAGARPRLGRGLLLHRVAHPLVARGLGVRSGAAPRARLRLLAGGIYNAPRAPLPPVAGAHAGRRRTDAGAHRREPDRMTTSGEDDAAGVVLHRRRAVRARAGAVLRRHVGVRSRASEDVAAPGDYVLRDVAGESVIVTRDEKGGAPGVLQRVPAPRHAALHRAQGQVRRAHPVSVSRVDLRPRRPARRGAAHGRHAGLPHARTSALAPVGVDAWDGYVFVTLNPSPEPLADQIGALAREVPRVGHGRAAARLSRDLRREGQLEARHPELLRVPALPDHPSRRCRSCRTT